MKNKIFKTIFTFLVIFSFITIDINNIMAVEVTTNTAIEEFNPSTVITGYKIYAHGTNTELTSINKDQRIDIEYTLKNTKVLTSKLVSDINKLYEKLDIVKSSDAFKKNTDYGVAIVCNSALNEKLSYTIKFSGLIYSGTGNISSFMIGYTDYNVNYENFSQTIFECVEYIPPVTEVTEATTEEIVVGNEPEIIVDSIRYPDGVKAGDTFSVTLILKNTSQNYTLQNIVMSYETTDGITSVDGKSKITVQNFNGNAEVTLNFKAENDLDFTKQKINLSFKYNYYVGKVKTAGSSSDSIIINVAKAPTTEVTTEAPKPEKAVPNLNIKNVEYPRNIEYGKAFTYKFDIKNSSSNFEIQNLIVTYEISDGLISKSSTNKFIVNSIAENDSITKDLKLLVADDVQMTKQIITFNFSYDYISDNKRQTCSSSETVTVLVTPKSNDNATTEAPQIKEGGSPYIIVDSYNYGGSSLDLDTNFSLDFILKNSSSKYKISNAVITVETSEGLTMLSASNKIFINSLDTKDSITKNLKLKVNKDATSSRQTVTLNMQYEYIKNGEITEGTTSEVINISVIIPEATTETSTEEEASMETPYIMVSSYDYGDKVPAGEKFNLDLTIRNTSNIANMENIVMSITVPDGLSITSSSNTFYFDELVAGGEKNQSLELQALSTTKSGSCGITISFKYEYLDRKTRNTVESSEIISIPIYQQDRTEFKIGEIEQGITVGYEVDIPISYVNKGRSDIYNVSAEISGNFDCSDSTQNLGNFEAGKSGNIDFFVTPMEAGTCEGVVTITYEDDNMEQKIIEVPISFEVEEMYMDDNFGDDYFYDDYNDFDDMGEDTSKALSKTQIIIIVVVIIVVLIVAGVIILKKIKKKRKLMEDLDDDFDDN